MAVLACLVTASPAAAAKLRDADHDGLSNRYEVKRSHTDPHRRDTDREGLSDGYEVRRSHTNPLRKDTDRDGLTDAYEVRRSHTSPLRKDTDRDGLTDRYEVKRSKTSPLNPDTDGDGTRDGDEVRMGTDPLARPVVFPAPNPVPAPPVADTTPPDTTIRSGPDATVATGDATFAFSSPEAGASFECRLDGADWNGCTSPLVYSGLANGQHTFEVRAKDAAGNTDGTPAAFSWTITPADTTPPDTTIFDGPVGTVAATDALFLFDGSENGASFECRLDGAAWGACSTPLVYSGLASGRHTFDVRAKDAAGNADDSPATVSWTISPDVDPAACATATPNVRNGQDPWGGCFPGPSNTGTPAGTVLTDYAGSCNITVADTVIDKQLIDCRPLYISADRVVITNSKINGGIWLDTPDGSGSVTVTDTTIDAGAVDQKINDGPRAICCEHFTAIRIQAIRGVSGGFCEYSCEVRDSFICCQDRDEGGIAHESAMRLGSGALPNSQRLIHNTLRCDGADVPPEGGCSADVTGYGDFDFIQNNLVENNLFEWSPTGGFCAYGGSSPGKPFSAGSNNTWQNNIFQRGPSGRCGVFGAIVDLDADLRGNTWTNNRWDTGELMAPEG